MIKKYLSLALLAILALNACKKETRPLTQIEDETIQTYLKSSNLTGFTKDESGFYYKVIVAGTGDAVDYPDFVGISQTTFSINKDASYEISKYSPRFDFLGYIKPTSWRESLKKIKKGGEVRVITPSYLAFGKDGSGSTIPGNAILDTKLSLVNDADRVAYDDALINAYLTENGLTATKDANGIYYTIVTPGTGTAITSPAASVKAAYTGKLLSGSVFDQASVASPATFVLSNTIEGWIKTIPLIKAGGKIKLYIPSRFAYGPNPPPGSPIPANANLEFEVELIEVTN